MSGSGNEARIQMGCVDFKRKNLNHDCVSRLQTGRLERSNRLARLPLIAAMPFTGLKYLRVTRIVEARAPRAAQAC